MHFATTYPVNWRSYTMRKFFILMLFALNLVSFNHAMASSHLDQTVIFNDAEEGEDKGQDEEKNPEDDCE